LVVGFQSIRIFTFKGGLTMPQFKPDFIKIPKEIRENPGKFSLTEEELFEVEGCNSVAQTPRMNAMLTDEQSTTDIKKSAYSYPWPQLLRGAFSFSGCYFGAR